MVRKGTGSSSSVRIAGDPQVVVDDVGQPDKVVGEPGAYAAAALGVPPVLHVPLDELARRRPQDLGPGDGWLGVQQGHDVLELVAKAVGPAALVQGRARPDPAGQRLVQRPAVDHQVERRLGRVHGDNREPPLPGGHGGRHRRLGRRHPAVRARQPGGLLGPLAGPQQHRQLPALARLQADLAAQGRAGIEARPGACRPAPAAAAPPDRPASRCARGTRGDRRCGRGPPRSGCGTRPARRSRRRRSCGRTGSPARHRSACAPGAGCARAGRPGSTRRRSVTVRRRGRSVRLVKVSSAIFTGSSSAIPRASREPMPDRSCSNEESPGAWRTVKAASLPRGAGVALHGLVAVLVAQVDDLGGRVADGIVVPGGEPVRSSCSRPR